MKRFVAAAAVIATMISTPALAWGEREQGILTGIIIGEVWDHIQRSKHQSYPQVIHRPGVVMPPHNPYNSPRLPGYSSGMNDPREVCQIVTRRHYNFTENIHQNCWGETLMVERVPRY